MKILTVECRNPFITQPQRILGAQSYRASLLDYYGDAEAIERAQQMAREFRDHAGLGSWSARNTIAAMEAAKDMGLTPCQIQKNGFIVKVADLP